MRKLLLAAFSLCALTASAQRTISMDGLPHEEFVGVWKVKIRCIENFCGDGRVEQTGNIQAQTWTISKVGDGFVLEGGKNVGTIKDSYFDGKQLVFERTAPGYGDNMVLNKITFQVDAGGKATGTRLATRPIQGNACVWRYTLTAVQ